MSTVILLAFLLFGVLGLVKLAGTVRRRATLAALPADRRQYVAEGISARITVDSLLPVAGLTAGTHTVDVDLAGGPGGFLVLTRQGRLIDVGPTHSTALQAARSPGPRRLVIEQQRAGATDPYTVRLRLELVVEEADAWARLLEPFVRPSPLS